MCVGWGRVEISRPKLKPILINAGDTLDLKCELSHLKRFPFQLQWHTALSQDVGDGRRVYNKIDTSSENVLIVMSRNDKGTNSTTWTQLIKHDMSGADAGSYRCSIIFNDTHTFPGISAAVDVYVLHGKTRSRRQTDTEQDSTYTQQHTHARARTHARMHAQSHTRTKTEQHTVPAA